MMKTIRYQNGTWWDGGGVVVKGGGEGSGVEMGRGKVGVDEVGGGGGGGVVTCGGHATITDRPVCECLLSNDE